MSRKQPEQDTRSDSPGPMKDPAQERDLISVGDAMVCFDNVVIRLGTLAAAIQQVEVFLRFHTDQLADTSDTERHTEVWRRCTAIVEALKAKWKEIKDDPRWLSCSGHADLYEFERRLYAWLADTLAFPDAQSKTNREIARLRHEGPTDDSDAAVRDWTLAMQRKSQGFFPTAHDIIHEAVAIEEHLQRARLAADAQSAAVGRIGPESKRAATRRKTRTRTRTKRTEPTSKMNQAYEAHKQGFSYRSIGAELGVSRTTVGKWVKIAKAYWERKNRSVRTKSLPTDRRGQAAVPDAES